MMETSDTIKVSPAAKSLSPGAENFCTCNTRSSVTDQMDKSEHTPLIGGCVMEYPGKHQQQTASDHDYPVPAVAEPVETFHTGQKRQGRHNNHGHMQKQEQDADKTAMPFFFGSYGVLIKFPYLFDAGIERPDEIHMRRDME